MNLYDLTHLPYFWEPYKKLINLSVRLVSASTNMKLIIIPVIRKLINSCIGENSLRIRDNVLSHFPNRVYNGLEDLAETILNPANCHSTRVNVSVKDNYDFASPEPVYVYTLLSQI